MSRSDTTYWTTDVGQSAADDPLANLGGQLASPADPDAGLVGPFGDRADPPADPPGPLSNLGDRLAYPVDHAGGFADPVAVVRHLRQRVHPAAIVGGHDGMRRRLAADPDGRLVCLDYLAEDPDDLGADPDGPLGGPDGPAGYRGGLGRCLHRERPSVHKQPHHSAST